jgi:hypothetical protein
MNCIIRHIPDFCEGFDKSRVNFTTTDELLSIDFVKSWSEDHKFHRFSISDDCYLMAEFKGGTVWYVIGRLAEPVDLPKWKPIYTRKEEP